MDLIKTNKNKIQNLQNWRLEIDYRVHQQAQADTVCPSFLLLFKCSSQGKDHIYGMVIVEGRCAMARLSSLGANCSLVDTKV